MNLSLTEQLSYSTVRIECTYRDGSKGTGTGYFFIFKEQDDGTHVPVIITNKHVIENSLSGQLTFTNANDNNEPINDKYFNVKIDNFESYWKKHPDKSVDICAMPIQPFIAAAMQNKQKPFYVALPKTFIPSDDQVNDLSTMEEIIMIGYPNGIWDKFNNKPIFRKGITATHPALDYDQRKEFMIDAACFPGSSGSPVFLLNENGFRDKKGNVFMGQVRIFLLGTLYAGPQQTISGDIQIVNVPVVQKPIALSAIPINLGLIIKSKRIFELEKLF